MNKFGWYLFNVSFFSIAWIPCFAHSYGPPSRVTAAPGDNARACTQCHTGTINTGSGSVGVTLLSDAVYIPGVKQRVTVQVQDPDQQRWGFELSARLNSSPATGQAGDFTPVDSFTQVVCEDNGPVPCASGPLFIMHTSAGTRNGAKGGVSFQFDWTPPSTNVGPVTFYFAGNAANGDANLTGDHVYTGSLQLDPVIPAAPSVTAGNIVSAATSAAGPVTANSWVTAYGSNLGVTTRSWSDSDFTNGGLPTSLDGVSVVLTVFGAPRLAYVGYVSPTQVNFLLPSDAASSAYQVQVRNPAGITTALPLTLQANAPQLLTVDGKFAMGTHTNGSALGTGGTPAVPGETIILYGTGCGPTNPALIPSQVPTASVPLARLPTVTIGGADANVVSGNVLAGSPGVYQLTVQVPASTPNGDQAVVVTLATATSAPTLITVQK
jgi:uncharacterized protein (TIGR03437 family)